MLEFPLVSFHQLIHVSISLYELSVLCAFTYPSHNAVHTLFTQWNIENANGVVERVPVYAYMSPN